MKLLDRFFALVDSAIEAVIGAVIDRIFLAWAEEMAQAAKEEGEPGAADVSRDPHRPTPSGLQPGRLARADDSAADRYRPTNPGLEDRRRTETER